MLLITSRFIALFQTCVLFLLILYIVSFLDTHTVSSFWSQSSSSNGRVLESPLIWKNREQFEDTGRHDNETVGLANSTAGYSEHRNETINHGGGGVEVEDGAEDEAEPENPGSIDNGPKVNLASSLLAKARTLMPAILDPDNTSIDRMSCPRINTTRYGYLRPAPPIRVKPIENIKRKYIFALNLRKCVDLLPRLMGSIVEATNFLGPQYGAVSIVEGNSDDGTLEVLRLLRKELAKMGVAFWLSTSSLNPNEGPHRIKYLAHLRNLALEQVLGPADSYHTPITQDDLDMARSTLRHFAEDDDPEVKLNHHSPTPSPHISGSLSEDTTILFINDIVPCPEDLLELLHQRLFQSADMVCALDWIYSNQTATFYDVWVSRTVDGDLFFDIPPFTGSWEHSAYLFPTEPITRSRFEAGLPFQVFSCWNGAVAFTAKPLVQQSPHAMRFRWPMVGECFQGEPQLFCKDLWWAGFGRIAVVPSVNLAYTDAEGRNVKQDKGFVRDFVSGVEEEETAKKMGLINWQLEPPEKVKCMPGFMDQTWLRWNESLTDDER